MCCPTAASSSDCTVFLLTHSLRLQPLPRSFTVAITLCQNVLVLFIYVEPNDCKAQSAAVDCDEYDERRGVGDAKDRHSVRPPESDIFQVNMSPF